MVAVELGEGRVEGNKLWFALYGVVGTAFLAVQC